MKGKCFKPYEIEAILDRRKTTFREVIKPQPPSKYHSPIQITGTQAWGFQKPSCADLPFLIKPRYQQGETVYLKEAWATKPWIENNPAKDVWYKDTSEGIITPIQWHSPMMMPEKYARHFIKIVAVRAERLQEITEEECLKEGIERHTDRGNNIFWYEVVGSYHGDTQEISGIKSFAKLWNSINPKYPFESNPWVWVYTFRLKEGK